MSGTFDLSNDNIISRLLNTYAQIETAKVDQRLNATDQMQAANNIPSQSSNPQAASAGLTNGASGNGMSWGMLALLAGGAVLVVAVLR